MKRFLLFTLSILYTILGMNPAAVRAGTNVWTSIGPDGGRVQAIAFDPHLIAGAHFVDGEEV